MRPNWKSFKESHLRGLKETPLRALQTADIKMNQLYALINVVSRHGGELGLGDFLSNGNEVLRVWNKYYLNVATGFYDSVVLNSPLPVQINVGDLFDAGDPDVPDTERANWWFDLFAADLTGWRPGLKPVTEWDISAPGSAIGPGGWTGSAYYIINGFAVWPNEVCDMVLQPDISLTTYKCVSKARRGASITLCKKDITGIVTIHDPIARPVGDWTASTLSAPSRIGSHLVNITADANTGSIYDPDYEYIFDCAPDKVLCFWLGKSFEQLPNSGPPHFTPIEFNPWDYGLLSSYAPINPPYP